MINNFDINRMNRVDRPYVELFFYRKISHFLTPKVAKFFPWPNLVSLIGFLIGMVGIAMVGLGDYHIRIIGCLVLLVSYIFDCVDGELARGLGTDSRFGALLDTTFDSIKESLIFVAIAWSNYIETTNHDIFFYLIIILFLQRMFGRTFAWYRLLFSQTVKEIKEITLKDLPKFLKIPAILFSEAYGSGAIWVIVFLGVLINQTKPLFVYFIIVLFALFLFLLVKAYRCDRRGKYV